MTPTRRSFLARLLAALGLGGTVGGSALLRLSAGDSRGPSYVYDWRGGTTWTDDPAYNVPGGPALSYGLHNHTLLDGADLRRGTRLPDGKVCWGPLRLKTGADGWVEMYCADPAWGNSPILTADMAGTAVFRYRGRVTFRDDEFGNILSAAPRRLFRRGDI